MSHGNQHTIENQVSLEGVGVHSGAPATITFLPGEPDTGVRFRRMDLEGAPEIPVDLDHVTGTELGTRLGEGDASVMTVEHVMAALAARKIDNVILELSGPEPPLLDGSFQPYLEALGVSAGDLPSVAGRHLARALETKLVADAMAGWLLELDVDEPAAAGFEIPDRSDGAGITDAPRGAVGHWIRISDKKTENYQLVVPTTWNAGPTDAEGHPGPIEQALMGTQVKDEENPFEVVRIVRSFDPCLACAVHIVDASGNKKQVMRVL